MEKASVYSLFSAWRICLGWIRESSDSDLFQLVDHESICHDEENKGDLTLDQINVATGDFIIVEYKEPNGDFLRFSSLTALMWFQKRGRMIFQNSLFQNPGSSIQEKSYPCLC